MTHEVSDYVATSTGNRLVRKPDQFHYRGKYFHGLVDDDVKAVYTDPEDDFAVHVGITSSLAGGEIRKEPL